jgi:divalent metal cation (Fe/Co/Zn/Cd) transporter
MTGVEMKRRTVTRIVLANLAVVLALSFTYPQFMISPGRLIDAHRALTAGWPQGDPIAAIGVALFVCLAGWRLGRRTIDALIDTAQEGSAEAVRRVIADLPAVIGVERVRVLAVGSTLFVESR